MPIPVLNSSSFEYILLRSDPAVLLPPLAAVLGFDQAEGRV